MALLDLQGLQEEASGGRGPKGGGPPERSGASKGCGNDKSGLSLLLC